MDDLIAKIQENINQIGKPIIYCPEEENKLKPIERFQALLDGKKIKKDWWPSNHFISLDPNRALIDTSGNDFGEVIDLFNEVDQWELHEESKPQIKLTPEMVGRKVRLRNDDIGVLIFHRNSYNIYYVQHPGHPLIYSPSGKEEDVQAFDIVEILPQ